MRELQGVQMQMLSYRKTSFMDFGVSPVEYFRLERVHFSSSVCSRTRAWPHANAVWKKYNIFPTACQQNDQRFWPTCQRTIERSRRIRQAITTFTSFICFSGVSENRRPISIIMRFTTIVREKSVPAETGDRSSSSKLCNRCFFQSQLNCSRC